MNINKKLKEGGWRSPQHLFEEDGCDILILYNTSKVYKGKWHKETSWVETKKALNPDSIVGWKKDPGSWFSRLFRKA